MSKNPDAMRANPLGYIIPASETEEGRERERAYYEALGRFVDMFAKVESTVAQTLWAYANVTPATAKIIFAGTRMDGACGYIKQIAEASNAAGDARNDLADVLQQATIINGARNAILHYGATSIAEGEAIVSDALKAKGEPTEIPISPTALNNMTADCRKIVVHLGYRHLKRPPPLGQFGRNVLNSVLRAPWQYKHPVPKKLSTRQQESQPRTGRGPKPPPPLGS